MNVYIFSLTLFSKEPLSLYIWRSQPNVAITCIFIFKKCFEDSLASLEILPLKFLSSHVL